MCSVGKVLLPEVKEADYMDGNYISWGVIAYRYGSEGNLEWDSFSRGSLYLLYQENV